MSRNRPYEKIIRYVLDFTELPALTDLQKAELEALAKLSDETIDYSDIPPLSDAAKLQRLKDFVEECRRQSLSLRDDPQEQEILDWTGLVSDLTAATLIKSEKGEDVHHAKDAQDLFDKLGI